MPLVVPTPRSPATSSHDAAVARVFEDTRREIVRLARNLMAGLGVPLILAEIFMSLDAGQNIGALLWAKLGALAITPAALLVIPPTRIRMADCVLVGGLGLAVLSAVFQTGPAVSAGIMYAGWVIAAVFFIGGFALPVTVSVGMVLTMWIGDGRLPVAFAWSSGRSGLSWLLSLMSVVGVSLGIALVFRQTLNRLRQAVRDEARARDEVTHAQHEREEALSRAAQAQRLEALGRLAGGVAHDFNNAIAIVALGIDELREPSSSDERDQVLADMTRATRGAEATTRQLLSFARQGSTPGSRAAPDVVVRGMATSLRRLFPESIHVLVHAAPVGEVAMAAGDLEQVMLNLCLNARDAVPDGGTLTLHVRRSSAGEATLEVRDTGVGMTEDVRARALDPFFTTKSKERGTGLGLAMVGAAVQRAQGAIEIESVPELGTTVRLRLPLAPSVDPVERVAEPRASAFTTGHVLVLEDEPQLQRLLQRGLERAGHRVTIAGTVGDALMALEASGPVDLLLTDAVLPDGGPTRLIQAYRIRHPDGPVLVCSGYVPAPDLIAGIEADAYAFFQKPFDAAALMAAVTPLPSERTSQQAGVALLR